MEVPSRFEIDDAMWAEVEPLIPVRERRRRYPGRKAIPDRLVLNGILHVLHTGIAWEDLPQEYGYGSGVTAWRRLRDWQAAGVWDALHQKFLEKLNAAGAIVARLSSWRSDLRRSAGRTNDSSIPASARRRRIRNREFRLADMSNHLHLGRRPRSEVAMKERLVKKGSGVRVSSLALSYSSRAPVPKAVRVTV